MSKKLVSPDTKGQLISKCPFGVFESTKKPTKFFVRISALASKKRLNQKKFKGIVFFLLQFENYLIGDIF